MFFVNVPASFLQYLHFDVVDVRVGLSNLVNEFKIFQLLTNIDKKPYFDLFGISVIKSISLDNSI